MITNFKFRDLTPGDVEVRVAMCRANGLSLLIYKDARVDQQILDETVGQLNWKKSYREVKGNLYCTIEIWDSDKRMRRKTAALKATRRRKRAKHRTRRSVPDSLGG